MQLIVKNREPRMTEGITGKAKYQCNKCEQEYSLHKDDFDFEAVSGSERNMGLETQYISEYNHCCDCANDINIEFEVWEYPSGIINHITHSESGAINVDCNFSITYREEEYQPDEENNRVVGAVTGGAILGASLGGPVGALIGGVIGGILGDSVNNSKKGGENNG